MSAKPIPPGDYSPPPPEVRHLLGSFAELRARIRARRPPGLGALTPDVRSVDPGPPERPADPSLHSAHGDD